MAGTINKGTINTINGTTARVSPCSAAGLVSPQQVVIPWHLRGASGNLTKGTTVVYVLFEDQTGILLGRADGDWGNYLPVLTVETDINVGDEVKASGNVSAASMSAGGDVTAGSISLKNHTHSAVTAGPDNTGKPQ